MSPIPASSIIPTSTSATKTTASTPTAITGENIPDAPSATALNTTASVINSVYSTPTHHRCDRACLANALINYVYTGKMEMTPENVMGMVAFAKMLKIPAVEMWGANLIADSVTLENLATTWDFAKSLNIGLLMDACINLMEEQLIRLISDDIFVRLPGDTVLSLVRSEDLSVDSEEQVFEAISRWVCPGGVVDEERLRIYAPKMLKEVQWHQTTSQFREHLLDNHPIYQTNIECAEGGTLIRLSSCEVYDVSQERWYRLPDLREKRNGPAAVCLPHDNRVFVIGGKNDSAWTASVEFCQLRADWQRQATSSSTDEFWLPAAPMRTARAVLSVTHFRGKIIAAGGYDGNKKVNVVEMFSPPDTRCPLGQWTDLAAMKQPRSFFTLVTTRDTVFALVYDVSQERWYRLPDLREKRNGPAAVCLPHDNRVFVIGGKNDSAWTASVEFCQLRADWQRQATSSSTDEFWLPAAPMRTARAVLSVTHFRGKIIAAGGYDGNKKVNVVEMFSPPDTRCPLGQWTDLAAMKQPRSFFTLVTTRDTVFALGNDERSGNTVEALTAPEGSVDHDNDLTSWIWSTKSPVETLAEIRGASMSPNPTSSIIPTSTSATKTTASTLTHITGDNIPDATSATALTIIASVISSVDSIPTHHRCYRAWPGPTYQCQEFRYMPIGSASNVYADHIH
nr:unnamed protein product [Spirometra erinaceieuropaei]